MLTGVTWTQIGKIFYLPYYLQGKGCEDGKYIMPLLVFLAPSFMAICHSQFLKISPVVE